MYPLSYYLEFTFGGKLITLDLFIGKVIISEYYRVSCIPTLVIIYA